MLADARVASFQVAHHYSSNEDNPAPKRIAAFVSSLSGDDFILQNNGLREQNILHYNAMQYAMGALGRAMLLDSRILGILAVCNIADAHVLSDVDCHCDRYTRDR